MTGKENLIAGWKSVRPDLTSGVRGMLLRDGAVKIVLTRVAPGGSFSPHRDVYAHLFHVRRGQLRLQIGGEIRHLGVGDMSEVSAGTVHGYVNDGLEELEMLSVNIYS